MPNKALTFPVKSASVKGPTSRQLEALSISAGMVCWTPPVLFHPHVLYRYICTGPISSVVLNYWILVYKVFNPHSLRGAASFLTCSWQYHQGCYLLARTSIFLSRRSLRNRLQSIFLFLWMLKNNPFRFFSPPNLIKINLACPHNVWHLVCQILRQTILCSSNPCPVSISHLQTSCITKHIFISPSSPLRSSGSRCPCPVPVAELFLGFYSNLFTILLPKEGIHPILDLKALNVFIWVQKFPNGIYQVFLSGFCGHQRYFPTCSHFYKRFLYFAVGHLH